MVGVCAIIVCLLAVSVAPMQPPPILDEEVAHWAAGIPESVIPILRSVTWLGASLTIAAVFVLVAGLSLVRGHGTSVTVFLAVVLGGEIVLSNALKHAVDRARPALHQMVDTTGSSFPSGHSAAAAAAYMAIALVLTRGRAPVVRRGLLAGAVTIALLVGSSRVFLGVHWLTDVVGGLAFGWGWVTLCALVIFGRSGREAFETGSPMNAPVRSPQ